MSDDLSGEGEEVIQAVSRFSLRRQTASLSQLIEFVKKLSNAEVPTKSEETKD